MSYIYEMKRKLSAANMHMIAFSRLIIEAHNTKIILDISQSIFV